jgi:transcriptional regulator with XRE-family HTH domain
MVNLKQNSVAARELDNDPRTGENHSCNPHGRSTLDIDGLQRRMRDAGIRNATELAERLDVSRVSVSQWLNGRAQPGLESLRRIAALFRVRNVESLFGDAGAKSVKRKVGL